VTARGLQPPPAGLIPLTRNEIARLVATVIAAPAHGTGDWLHCSAWRRRHQHRSMTAHYSRQAREGP
jgi:hypothetical protein